MSISESVVSRSLFSGLPRFFFRFILIFYFVSFYYFFIFILFFLSFSLLSSRVKENKTFQSVHTNNFNFCR